MRKPTSTMPREVIIDTGVTFADLFLAYPSWDEYFNNPANYRSPVSQERKDYVRERTLDHPYGNLRWCEKEYDTDKGAVYADQVGNLYHVPSFAQWKDHSWCACLTVDWE